MKVPFFAWTRHAANIRKAACVETATRAIVCTLRCPDRPAVLSPETSGLGKLSKSQQHTCRTSAVTGKMT
jgi:hypothetical protein